MSEKTNDNIIVAEEVGTYTIDSLFEELEVGVLELV